MSRACALPYGPTFQWNVLSDVASRRAADQGQFWEISQRRHFSRKQDILRNTTLLQWHANQNRWVLKIVVCSECVYVCVCAPGCWLLGLHPRYSYNKSRMSAKGNGSSGILPIYWIKVYLIKSAPSNNWWSIERIRRGYSVVYSETVLIVCVCLK